VFQLGEVPKSGVLVLTSGKNTGNRSGARNGKIAPKSKKK